MKIIRTGPTTVVVVSDDDPRPADFTSLAAWEASIPDAVEEPHGT